MITINYEKKANKLEIEGHALYAPMGEDIVCAAVSALTYALQATFEMHPEYKGEWMRIEDSVFPKFIAQVCEDGKQSMETVICGLMLFAENYPQYITFIERS